MSGYGSAYGGYPTYNGLAPQTDPRGKTSYVSDHVCKPVIVDAEGRKHPIVYNPGSTTETCITKTETVVQQQVRLPFSTEYKHSSLTKFATPNHNGYVEDKWHQSSSPVHDRPHKVEEFFAKVQTEVSQPKKFSILSPSSWRQPPNSAGYHGPRNTGYGDYNDKSNKDWPKPSGNVTRNGNPISTGYHEPGNTGFGDYNDKSNKDWPKPSGNTIRNGNPISTGYHEPGNTGYGDYNDKSNKDLPKPSRNTIWNGNPISTGYHEPGNIGYGDYNDKSNKDWPKTSENTNRKGNYDGNYHNQNNDSRMEPTMINSGGWTRPSHAGWAAPPDTSLSRPTNDIGTAMEFLMETSKPTSVTTSPHSRHTEPITTGRKKDGYGETIDSREASKRYGHYPSFQSEEKYTSTIDSREAARKYKGAAVPM